jgi:hypothetical protein
MGEYEGPLFSATSILFKIYQGLSRKIKIGETAKEAIETAAVGSGT